MKTSVILFGVGAAMAAAQDITYPSGFPDCGKTCINNMLNQASELGCTDVAPSCLCTKQNFIYGVRDCATESCQDQSLAQQVIQYGSQYCASVGVEVSGIPTATGTNPSASTTLLATASPTNNPIVGSQGSNSNGATGSIAISTATFETSFTTSGSAIESTVTSTIYSGEASSSGTAASGSASGSESTSESGSGTASVIESTITTNGSTLTTTASSTEATGSQASESGSSESSTGSNGESASSTSNPAAQRTAAPVGFIAAAGLAALML